MNTILRRSLRPSWAKIQIFHKRMPPISPKLGNILISEGLKIFSLRLSTIMGILRSFCTHHFWIYEFYDNFRVPKNYKMSAENLLKRISPQPLLQRIVCGEFIDSWRHVLMYITGELMCIIWAVVLAMIRTVLGYSSTGDGISFVNWIVWIKKS